MAQSLSTSFMGVKRTLDTHLKLKRVCFSNYNTADAALNCAVKTYTLNDVGKGPEGDNSANVTLTMSYTAVVATETSCESADKVMTLNILSTISDRVWGPIMKARVWRGDYPSAVGIDADDGTVYLLFLRDYGVELRYFATLTEPEKDAIETLHIDAPYMIGVEEEALFDCLEGDIGNKVLRENVYIKLNCMPPVKLRALC